MGDQLALTLCAVLKKLRIAPLESQLQWADSVHLNIGAAESCNA